MSDYICSYLFISIILMHENQIVDTIVNLFLNFVINSPMAENGLSGSTNEGLIVSKAQHSFSRLSGLFLLPQKDSFPFPHLEVRFLHGLE